MAILMMILTIALGAFLNRVRGGLFEKLPCNKIFFPIFIAFVIQTGWESYLCALLSAYIGQQVVGWGAYIGALTCGNKPTREECALIEDNVNELRISVDGKKYWLKDYYRAWGFVCLSLRGLIWTYALGMCATSISIAFCGLMMGVCYLIPTLILWNTKYHNNKTAWNCGEWIFGGLLTVFCLWG